MISEYSVTLQSTSPPNKNKDNNNNNNIDNLDNNIQKKH